MKIAIYGRVSTKKQLIEGSGLDVQIEELIKEAEKNGDEYQEYIDSGISGTSIEKRDGLQKLLEDIKLGEIKEVHVTKLSRLGRNTRDVLNILHEFEKYNVIFKSVRDGIDTSSTMGKIMVQFLSIIAEMERDVIIETTKAGSDFRAQSGKIYGSPDIFGYDREGHGKNSYLSINNKESEIIKKIYVLYVKGHGYKAIVTRINGDGFRTKHGNLFALPTIKTILRNPLYIGKIRYNLHKDWLKKRRRGKQSKYILVDGLHKAIIDEKTWNIVQKRMDNNVNKRQPATGKFLLNGILKCPQCGSGMVGSNRLRKTKNGKVSIPYYTCGANHNKGRVACSANSMNGPKVEEIVIKQISEYLKAGGLAQKLYEYIIQNSTDTSKYPTKLKALNNDLNSIDNKIGRIRDMYVESFINHNEMTQKMSEYNIKKSDIERQINILRQQLTEDIVPEIDITVTDIQSILDNLTEIFSTTVDRLLLKKFLRTVIESIEVENRLKVDMKVNVKFTDELLRLFNKDIPISLSFKYEDNA